MFKSDYFKIIALFLTWRIFIFALAFLSPLFIPNFGATFPYYEDRLIGSGLPHFLWSFGNFDGVHYLGIAKVGYAYQFTQAFFPLYPIIIKLTSLAFFGNLLISALVVSNTLFLVGLVFFFKLIKENFNSKTAYWSIIFLLAFPTSYYFGSVYTEGLFFALITISFYLAQNNKSFLASIFGSFASATRLIGLFLAPGLYLIKNLKNKYFLLLIPLGLILYMVYLKLQFNNPIYFLTSQEIFGQARSTTKVILLPQVYYRYFQIIISASGLPLYNAIFELVCTTFALAVLLFNYKKIKKEWLVFSLLSIITPTLTGTFASMPRYVLLAFPLFIYLAQLKNTTIKIIILILFISSLCVATTLFTQGYWVA